MPHRFTNRKGRVYPIVPGPYGTDVGRSMTQLNRARTLRKTWRKPLLKALTRMRAAHLAIASRNGRLYALSKTVQYSKISDRRLVTAYLLKYGIPYV